jgi:hypothetical protein
MLPFLTISGNFIYEINNVSTKFKDGELVSICLHSITKSIFLVVANSLKNVVHIFWTNPILS